MEYESSAYDAFEKKDFRKVPNSTNLLFYL